MSFVGGLGMNTGIQDAYNLGCKLAAALQGGALDALLGTYAEERIPIAEELLRTTSAKQQALVQAATGGKGPSIPSRRPIPRNSTCTTVPAP